MHLLNDLMCAWLTCTHLSPPRGDEGIKKKPLKHLVLFYRKNKPRFYIQSVCVFCFNIHIFSGSTDKDVISGLPPGGFGTCPGWSHLLTLGIV